MKQIELLKWDTKFFRFQVGELEIDSTDSMSEVNKALEESFFRVVYIKIENPSKDDIERISRFASLMDERVIFEKRIREVSLSISQRLDKYKGGITSELIELAWSSGTFSRFNLDANFRPYFKRLYKHWMEKSIQGDLADTVFVVYDRAHPVGFITVTSKNEKSAKIGLIAVNCDYRRKGIASLLLRNTEAWCYVNEYKVIQVATQVRNVSACRLYEKCGYKCKTRYGIFHYWKNT